MRRRDLLYIGRNRLSGSYASRFEKVSAIRLGCLAFAICVAPSVATGQRAIGFGFCAPPYPPKCVADPATYGSPAETEKCQDDINHYVNSVSAYRLCQTQEVERAVRETNSTLQRWKCGLAAKAVCP